MKRVYPKGEGADLAISAICLAQYDNLTQVGSERGGRVTSQYLVIDV
jgi:hypothetical protein